MTQAPPTCMPPTDPQSCTEQIDTDRSAMIKYDHIVLAAVKLNDVALLERLLDTNAHARSQVGTAGNGTTRNTPIHEAVILGADEIVKALVSRGAKLDAVNAAGDTPLQLALNKRSSEMVRLLTGLADVAK
eukprot:INCI17516.6.p2 GENE.INCI17516.6~~INCI17516.6.p2  ORF type:complete len:131 (-),score=19.60 INCI17516.6:59-451(-)